MTAASPAGVPSAMMLAGCHLHPLFVVRVAGEPTAPLDALGTGETDRLWHHADSLRAALGADAPAACAELERLVPGLADRDASRAALAAKRLLFNGQAPKPAHLAALAGHVPADLLGVLDRLVALSVAIDATEQALAGSFEAEMAHGVPALPSLLAGSNLRAALGYANPVLLAKLARHVAGTPADAKTTRNFEDSLLQYHARASTKTSPLSSFTVIGVGRWAESGGTGLHFPPGLRRRVAVKAGLMRHLLAPLLADFDLVRETLPVRFNASAGRIQGRIAFYRATPGNEVSGRTWGAGLARAELDDNGAIRLVESLLQGRELTLSTLAAALVERAPALAPGIDRFLRQLFDIGLLQVDAGLFEQDDPLAAATALIGQLRHPEAPALLAQFDQVAAALATLCSDDAEAHATATAIVGNAVRAVAALTGAETDSPLFRPAFHENCYLGAPETPLSSALLAPHADALSVLQDLSLLLDPHQELHSRMVDAFVARFGEGGECGDPRAFLEEFDAHYAPGVLDRPFDSERTTPPGPCTAGLLRAKAAFDHYLETLLRHGEDIDLDLDTLRAIVDMMPPTLRARSASYSHVVQVARYDGRDTLVLNQVFGGRSSILSRFLEIADEDALADTRDYLATAAEAAAVELPGVFGFNANRHPPLLSRELDVPPFPPSHAGIDRIALADTRLFHDPDLHRLRFRDGNGRAFDLHYQGLLIPGLLPQLHRVLALAFTEGPSLAITKALAARSLAAGETVSRVPRIRLGDILLLRQTWLVSPGEYPEAAQPPLDFYRAARRWQTRLGLPQRFFVRALPSAGEGKAIDWGAVNFKDMKPFFVDLASPRFVRLLQNMLKRSRLTLSISELLPAFGDSIVQVGGEPRVAELHFELTRPARAVPTPARQWFRIEVGYFDPDRTRLMADAIAPTLSAMRADKAVSRAWAMPRWKFGPHVELVVECEPSALHARVFPAALDRLEGWLKANPSNTAPDPQGYDLLSKRLGMFELEPGPYLPLRRDNSVRLVPWRAPTALIHPAFADVRADLLSGSMEIAFALRELKLTDPNRFLLVLHGMLAATADSYSEGGMAQGFMSIRSHADYFFAAHDVGGAARRRFDAVDAMLGARADAITQAIRNRQHDSAGPTAAQRILAAWLPLLARTAAANRAVVDAHHAAIADATVHADLAERLRPQAPADLLRAEQERRITDIAEIFLQSERGRAAQRAPAFLAYRATVNFFYGLLPLLDVAPAQKFLLCHLTASSIERTTGRDWRQLWQAAG
ncbi:lantibiotic dehydratase [Sandaracinobacteroides saxicola]|uniref:Lantibiotic dehydratase n=1 Tax=Sandaracinobacteroides saxicola TaxID=2759707 RepID=A0A7G5IIU0_9SPHN|nr:lantibiotic dehydratase [Sandaracinobacteroides saxicola]QMW23282.1 lantibiotic dehydratase [Sandaracinobacteroides saxicola]